MHPSLKQLFGVFLIITNCAFAQCPENIGFEDGTFRNWQAFTGYISPSGLVVTNQPGVVDYRHGIISAADGKIDVFGKFPQASPNGGKYSVKLGNAAVGGEAERLSYTFTVPMIPHYSLILNYAMVLQNPDHGDFEQSRFTVSVYNVTDHQYVECPAFDFIAKNTLPGFKLSTAVVEGVSPTDTYYKDWTTTTIDLSNLLGKTITIDFSTNDCSQLAHFGYVYFDINESCTQQAVSGNIYCEGQQDVKLTGPRGFSSYTWYNEDKTIQLGHDPDLVISPAPPHDTKYFLAVKAIPGLGCDGLFDVVVKKSETTYELVTKPVLYICNGSSADLTAAQVTAGSTPGMAYEYYKDFFANEYLRNPNDVKQEGSYYIKATAVGGCVNIAKIEVKFYDAVNLITSSPSTLYPDKIDLAAAHNRDPTYKYFYYKDAAGNVQVENYREIDKSGIYYVKAVNTSGCEKIAAVKVAINPPPPNVIEGPTAFTPNNDGINDKFMISIKGFVSFGSLHIYNRNGQPVFTAKSQSELWDGTMGGRNLPFGVYYWVFTGTDQYYHNTVTKSGHISIIK